MDWSTLAPTALGGLLAICGGLMGQWWGERRASEREERSLRHEQHTWSRAQRRDAYAEYVGAFMSVFEQSRIRQYDKSLPLISLDELDAAGFAVQVFGSRPAINLAIKARRSLLVWGGTAATNHDPEERKGEHVLEVLEEFKQRVRLDLGIDD